MNNKSSETILVTGATGFIASHIILQLLEAGYNVRGTARELGDTKKYDFLYNFAPEYKSKLQLVKADLLNKQSLDDAANGCKYVMHVASPDVLTSKDPNEILRPAIEGTVNVLTAALVNNVKKVIITSSIAAIAVGNQDKILDENDWSIENECGIYEKSKLLAEKAAWEFWRKNHNKIELAVINPGFVMGPALNLDYRSSQGFVIGLLSGNISVVPDASFGIVDVRDVARAHIQAMENQNTNGNRYMLVEKPMKLKEIAETLREEFGQFGYKIEPNVAGKFFFTIVGIFTAEARETINCIGKYPRFNQEKSIRELQIKYVSAKQSIIDMGYSVIKFGGVENKLPKDNNKKQ